MYDNSIGNAKDAESILIWVRWTGLTRNDCEMGRIPETPEGWTYVGHGSYRSVWLSPEGVAYKVNHNPRWCRQTEEELEKLVDAWEMETPEGCRLPKFDRFEVDDETVVAIEYIKGLRLIDVPRDRDELYDLLEECQDHYRLRDLHDENVIIEEGTGYLVPVDLGA